MKWNKFNNHLEIVLKSSSQVEVSEADFHVTNLKTVGSSEIQLCDLDKQDEYTRVTFSAQVAKVSEPCSVGAGKTKQEVLLCDASGSATLTLWEDDVNMLTENKSYQMNQLVVRSFLGKNHLSMPPSGATIDEIEDLEEVKTPSTSSIAEESDDPEHLSGVVITGVQQLENVHTCINCKKYRCPSRHSDHMQPLQYSSKIRQMPTNSKAFCREQIHSHCSQGLP